MLNIIVTIINCKSTVWVNFNKQKLNKTKNWGKLTAKYYYLLPFPFQMQSSSLCRTAQTSTYFFRYYRWPLFLIPHSPFPILHSPFPIPRFSNIPSATWVDNSSIIARMEMSCMFTPNFCNDNFLNTKRVKRRNTRRYKSKPKAINNKQLDPYHPLNTASAKQNEV